MSMLIPTLDLDDVESQNVDPDISIASHITLPNHRAVTKPATQKALAGPASTSVLPAPVGDLRQYLQAISQYRVLDVDEEQTLARRLHEHQDLDAARQLILHNLRFVVHIARGYKGYGLPLADLVQEGNVGLMKAVRRFDPNQGVRLVTFAVHWIRAEIHEFILRNWRIVKIATTKAQRKLFFNLRSSKRHLGWLNREEASAIADDLGVSERDVIEMERRIGNGDVALDPMPDDDSSSPLVFLADQHADDPAVLAEQDDWDRHYSQTLGETLDALDPRARDILTRRYLGEPKATLQELADEYGISAERIRQIERKAILKLRESLEV